MSEKRYRRIRFNTCNRKRPESVDVDVDDSDDIDDGCDEDDEETLS